MSKTTIAWATDTWNYLRAVDPATGKIGWHCVKIDSACKNCYAATFNQRKLSIGTGLDYVATSPAKTYVDSQILHQPLGWSKPKIIFPCSMTDWAADFVEPAWIWAALAIASACPRHKFLFLTKRPARLASVLVARVHGDIRDGENLAGVPMPRRLPDNVWLGFSAGTQATWDRSVQAFAELPHGETWASVEPMLEPVATLPLLNRTLEGYPSWLVIGGESGSSARPFGLDWARKILDDNRVARPCFVKQLGRHPVGTWGPGPAPLGSPDRWFLKDSKGEDMAEWPEDLRVRNWPW